MKHLHSDNRILVYYVDKAVVIRIIVIVELYYRIVMSVCVTLIDFYIIATHLYHDGKPKLYIVSLNLYLSFDETTINRFLNNYL